MAALSNQGYLLGPLCLILPPPLITILPPLYGTSSPLRVSTTIFFPGQLPLRPLCLSYLSFLISSFIPSSSPFFLSYCRVFCQRNRPALARFRRIPHGIVAALTYPPRGRVTIPKSRCRTGPVSTLLLLVMGRAVPILQSTSTWPTPRRTWLAHINHAICVPMPPRLTPASNGYGTLGLPRI